MRDLWWLLLWGLGCAAPAQLTASQAVSSSCGSCHAEQYDQFKYSRHADSAGSPVFAALAKEVLKSWGPVAADRCRSCHAPSHTPEQSVTCVSCHAAIGNRGIRDGRLLIDLELELLGPTGAANDAHATRTSGLLHSPELCGTCHEVTGPNLLLEPTFTEFKESPWRTAGRTCASCHMPHGEHRFVGVDPLWGAPADEQAVGAEQTRELLASALSLSIARQALGTGDQILVTLENAGAGHDVPTGAAFLRDFWVDVALQCKTSKDQTLQRVIELGNRPKREGVHTPLITDADAVQTRTLRAAEAITVTLEASSDCTAVAKLKARAIRQDVMNALRLERDEVVEHLVVEVSEAP